MRGGNNMEDKETLKFLIDLDKELKNIHDVIVKRIKCSFKRLKG